MSFSAQAKFYTIQWMLSLITLLRLSRKRGENKAIMVTCLWYNGRQFDIPIWLKRDEHWWWMIARTVRPKFVLLGFRDIDGTTDEDRDHIMSVERYVEEVNSDSANAENEVSVLPPWRPRDLFLQRRRIWETPVDVICDWGTNSYSGDAAGSDEGIIEQLALVLYLRGIGGWQTIWYVLPSFGNHAQELRALLSREDIVVDRIEIADHSNSVHKHVWLFWYNYWHTDYEGTPPNGPAPPVIPKSFMISAMTPQFNMRASREEEHLPQDETDRTVIDSRIVPIALQLGLEPRKVTLLPIPDHPMAERIVFYGQHQALSPTAKDTVGFAEGPLRVSEKTIASRTLFGLPASHLNKK